MTGPITDIERRKVADWIISTGRTAEAVTRGEIARTFGYTDRRARTIRDELRLTWDQWTANTDGTVSLVNEQARVDDLMLQFRQWVGWSLPVAGPPEPQPGKVKVLIAGDPHCPYQSESTLQAIAKEGADLVVLNGDVTDLQNWSRHSKFTQKFTPQEEIASAQAVLNFFAERFPETRIISGNHDGRWIKYLVSRNVEPGILEAFRLLCPKFDSPLHLLTKDLPNVNVADPVRVSHAEFGWFYQLGDLVTTHAEVYSRIPNRAVGNVIHWLKSFAQPQGLIGEFKVAIQNHTHQAGVTFNDYGIVGVENGCACLLGDYCASPQMMTPRPWINGFTTLTQVDGVTDLNSIRFHFVGFAS